jgi:uncharacterized protein YbjT (DUF2867 family)
MTYLITGATGNIGGRVVERLLKRGERPRILARDPDAARRQYGDQVEVTVGDLGNAKSLASAFAGAQAIFLINSGHELAARDAAAARVAKACGIEHLVKLSSRDIEQNVGTGPWHAQGEAAIRACGVPFTFIRPSGFMSNALSWSTSIKSGGVVTTSTGDGRISFIHPDDLADVVTKVLTERTHVGETLPITGPQALSYAEMAAEIGAVIGRRVTFETITDEQARARMSESWDDAPMVEAVVEIWRAVREGRLAAVDDGVRRLLGREPSTFDRWVQQNASSFSSKR